MGQNIYPDPLLVLLDRLTATRAGYLDAAISTAKNTVTVQRGQTSMAQNTTTDVVISAVDISKAFVNLNIQFNSLDSNVTGYAYLLDSTHIRIVSGAHGAYNVIFAWEVVQIA